ncbi:unnamed protein product [Meganyctiphanes norvegica]|uniref:Uncharacterized protein n=1 Tax=Meganyctiphanes norvegica TaxID=48144 RepID=A0AAV2Q2D3_MEGNR
MSFAATSLAFSEASGRLAQCPDDFEWQGDYDKEVRNCEVSLWTRPIIGLSEPGDPQTKHWALTFEWSDRIATYETNSTSGYLIPKWCDGKPRGKHWDIKLVRKIGSYSLSPNTVNSTAKANRLNCNKYLLGHMNSQQWASVFTKDLCIEMPVLTVAEEDPLCAMAATAVGSIM